MTEFLAGLKRTNMCGELSQADNGKQVTLMGWIHRRRDLGGLIFAQLRDLSGICQIVFDTDVCDKSLLDKASQLKLEYVVAITGQVRMRTQENINPNMSTGYIEVCAEQLLILSEANTTPFSIGDDSANESLRLTYRYLDLRRSALQNNLLLRSRICHEVRNYLAEQGFCEIETPMMGRSTPEGARDYLVPSRVHTGDYYALPQSPQLYKQLLMIGGMDRYYQIARCFRDEDLRANRQPEFTQIDMEMSFVDKEEEVMGIAEGLVKRLFANILNIQLPDFPRLAYADAMRLYGSDKPDTRYDMQLCNISSVVTDSGCAMFDNCLSAGGKVYAIVLRQNESNLSRKDLDKLVDFVKTYKVKGLAWLGLNQTGLRSSFAKAMREKSLDNLIAHLQLQQGDISFICADNNEETVQIAMGALRCHLADKFNLYDKNDYKGLWVVDFPLLEYSEEEGRYVAKHHPFTSPKEEDLHLLDTNPALVRAKAYDIVINGDEMGGGSMRIYNNDLQRKMFNVLGFDEQAIKDKFGFFVNAFNYGTPPHGGLAFGLDRMTMVMGRVDNIREVIAFPKTQQATCLMSGAPARVEKKQLDELGIRSIDQK
ncbi:MAG: aspartate--tRNA ligase [Clostridia bacterium]|nr:aspartate--tRNA ligase [Clostridia bacterium]